MRASDMELRYYQARERCARRGLRLHADFDHRLQEMNGNAIKANTLDLVLFLAIAFE